MTEEEVKQALKDRGIMLNIGGCGCCGSPWYTFYIDGVKVLDEDGGFDNVDPDPQG